MLLCEAKNRRWVRCARLTLLVASERFCCRVEARTEDLEPRVGRIVSIQSNTRSAKRTPESRSDRSSTSVEKHRLHHQGEVSTALASPACPTTCMGGFPHGPDRARLVPRAGLDYGEHGALRHDLVNHEGLDQPLARVTSPPVRDATTANLAGFIDQGRSGLFVRDELVLVGDGRS